MPDQSPVSAAPPGSRWSTADTEPVVCCVCGRAGEVVHQVPPFGVVRCPSCTLVFVSPRLHAAARQRLYDEPAYFDGGVYGDRTRRSPAMLLQRTWTRGRLAGIVRRRPAPGRLLEIGSGYGLFLAAARDAGYSVRGVELSRTGVGVAREELGLDVFAGQVADAPTEPADVICFWDTLEHVPDPLAFLGEVRSRLAPGGWIALSVPYVSSVPARVLGARWWTLKPEQHIWHFTGRTLALVAARAGLVITDVIHSPAHPANAGRLDSLVAFGRALPDRLGGGRDDG
ncbi:class I SAM-dependent methyltransferase [Nakamurella sp.]|uniref:class I SAM-dependent methyltransferase n=1 Tax=Nakamurella sp. TaxID=1869182 RepID=UPI003783B060